MPIQYNKEATNIDSYFRFRLSSELKKEFQKVCDQKGMSASHILVELIEQFVSENQ